MTQNLPLASPRENPSHPPQSDIRVARVPTLLPPKPELPSKWREKRQQVWSAARLRPPPTAQPLFNSSAVEDTQPSGAAWATSSFPTERSDAASLWVELRDDEVLSLDGGERAESSLPSRRLRLARALVWGGAEVTKGANALSLPLGLFVAGLGLILASGVQLFVVLPAQLLRHGVVQYAKWTLRHSSISKRARQRLAHS